jgi:NAD(P)H-nitrite reductase large subunit
MADYLICRCEDVSLSAVVGALEAGASNAQEVKMWTRAGMGPCQGRVCRSAVEALVEAQTEGVLPASSHMTVHLPVRPVALSDLIDEEEQS